MDKYSVINLIHILLYVPALFLLGFYNKHIMDNSKLYWGVAIFGFIVLAYHLYESYESLTKGRIPLIYGFHALIVGPLLLWIAAKHKIGYQEQSLLYILAGGAFTVHFIRLFNIKSE